MSNNKKFEDLFPPEEDNGDGLGEWTVYDPPGSSEHGGYQSGDAMTPAEPGWDGEPFQEIEGYEDLPSVDRGYMYMTGEELDNNGYGDYKGRAGVPETARDYRPIRFRRDRRIGCLGGIMYAVFIISISVILTCVGWMAANDVLALNKPEHESMVELPKYIFTEKEIDVTDDDGNVTGKKTVSSADIDYVADQLKDQGLIEYKFLFKLYAKISNADVKVNPGTYKLSTDFDYRALITKMQTGSESQERTKITFPEGFTMRLIFLRLEANDICSYEELMDVAANYDFKYSFLEDIELGDAGRLEGFLFPDTYEFYQGMSARKAIEKFLDTFHYKLTKEMLEQVEALGMTVRDVVNIASMIEKEAAVTQEEDDRAEISSVIYNRLRMGMYLGIDATILYSFPDDGRTVWELHQDETGDPYNTRTHMGLTPTPICNPGMAAINAALKPPSTNLLYYALDEDTGMHRFFTNEAEFNNFVYG